MKLNAKWIWKKQENYNQYNQTIIAKKEIKLDAVRSAKIYVTADSSYRLMINEEWINDGPARCWPEHYQYDEIDVTTFVKKGLNEIRIIARYWGVGNFHTVPKQAGLLCQLNIENMNGSEQVIISDDSWDVAEHFAWVQETPKASIQMEPQEFFDSRMEKNIHFEKAVVLFDVDKAPWDRLHPRDVALLTKKAFSFRSFMNANLVKRFTDLHYCIPTARLVNPCLIEANHNTSNGCGMATVITLQDDAAIKFYQEGMKISVDGKFSDTGVHQLSAGEHFVLAFVNALHLHRKEKILRIVDPPASMKMENPLDASFENPWCWIPLPEFAFAGDDMNWQLDVLRKEKTPEYQGYFRTVDQYFAEIQDKKSFMEKLAKQAQCMPSNQMFVNDSEWEFVHREAIGDASEFVHSPKALMYDNGELTTVNPSETGDIELVYDLGEQNCGYYNFDVIADEGVFIDIYGIEYINKQGIIQHTTDNRNGFRYITHAGVNRFTSLKRRSGRYIFITFRNMKSPVKIRKIQLIESTYPVNEIGTFQCSDIRLDKIWEISVRTLKLCMEDTFTDCPLYEQTLWVGDARNESLFAYAVFGATDIAERCIKIAGQSLERYPIVGCQVPSSWDCILPAWSFLWGISVWDYYFYSGNLEFLKKTWGCVIQNLQGTEKFLTEDGLFSAPFWNLFDWSGIDDQHDIVLHNSMLVIGAINAALNCAHVMQDDSYTPWLIEMKEKMKSGIEKFWDEDKEAYRDSVLDDGSQSPSTSQHTSFFSVLYDIVPEDKRNAAIKNIVDPPEEMIKVGSPFAMMYYYEALEKIGLQDNIIQSIYESYLPMLEEGATTVWEIFPSSNYRPGIFPARSHCHAWSSAPVYFLGRIVLGVIQAAPGGTEFIISPRLNGLTWAKGSVATIKGKLSVEWKVEDSNLNIRISAPKGVQYKFIENETHKGLKISIDKF